MRIWIFSIQFKRVITRKYCSKIFTYMYNCLQARALIIFGYMTNKIVDLEVKKQV